MEETGYKAASQSLSDVLSSHYQAYQGKKPILKQFNPTIIQELDNKFGDSMRNGKFVKGSYRDKSNAAGKRRGFTNSKFVVVYDNRWENYDKRLSHLMSIYKDEWKLIEPFFNKNTIRYVYTRFLILKSRLRSNAGEEGKLPLIEVLKRQVLVFKGCLEIISNKEN